MLYVTIVKDKLGINTPFYENINFVDALLHPNRRGFSKKMCDMLGVSKEAVSNWRNRGVVPHQNNLKRFAEKVSRELTRKFNQDVYFTPSQLKEEDLITIIEKFRENTDQYEVKESVAPYYQHRTNFGLKQPDWVKDLIPHMIHSIPVFNSIPEGEPHELTDSRYILKNADEFVMTGVRDVHAYALAVIGDIMEPTLSEGDRIIVSPNSETANKCVVVYRLNNGKAGLSRFRQIGTEIYLEFDADTQEIIQHNITEFIFIHRVVEVIKKL